jgi:transposase-like protein
MSQWLDQVSADFEWWWEHASSMKYLPEESKQFAKKIWIEALRWDTTDIACPECGFSEMERR